MNLKSRLAKLERQHGAKPIQFVILSFIDGKVHDVNNGDPALLGMTETDIDALFAARDDVQVIKVLRVSDALQKQQAVNCLP